MASTTRHPEGGEPRKTAREIVLELLRNDLTVRGAVAQVTESAYRRNVERVGNRVDQLSSDLAEQAGRTDALEQDFVARIEKGARTATGAIHAAVQGIKPFASRLGIFEQRVRNTVAAIVILFLGFAVFVGMYTSDVLSRKRLLARAEEVITASSQFSERAKAIDSALTRLEGEQTTDNSFRPETSSALHSLQGQVALLSDSVEELRGDMRDLRKDMDREFGYTRQDTNRLERRVAPIEAVALTNQTRFYRNELDRMAGTQCSRERDRDVERRFAGWHVRSCKDGWNQTRYRVYCSEFSADSPNDEQFSGCQSTEPGFRS